MSSPTKWTWTDRTFTFDFPPSKMPDLIERVRGLCPRIEDRIHGVAEDILTRRDDTGWSIQENVGHLLDLEYLPMRRIDEILAGEQTLSAADMTNRATHEAEHNEKPMSAILSALRTERGKLVAKFESLSESDWGKSAMHPRIHQPMRIVDIAYFNSEHDDYHLARIGELLHKFSR